MPESLRIGLLTHSVNPRGGVVHTLELAAALHRLGHRVTVFAPALPGQTLFRPAPHELDLVPVQAVEGGLADLVADRIEAFRDHLGARLAHERFDVLHAHDGIGGNALADLVEAGLIDGFVRTVHHLDPFDDARLARWQTRSVTAARQVLCVSATWRERLLRELGVEAAQVANGVDCQRFGRRRTAHDAALLQRLGLRPGAPLFLAVGGIEARKNSVRLLAAFLRLRGRLPGAQLVLAGGASLLDHADCVHEFRMLAEAAALPPGVLVLTGPLADADMPALYRAADALVMPSLREGFGLAVLEALACGTPVVVSDIAPFTEYLAETVAQGHALYADPLDHEAIAAAMQRAAEPQRASALALEVPAVCLDHGWDASARRHVAIYLAQRALARAAALSH